MTGIDPQVKAAVFDIGATLVTGPPVAPNKAVAALIGTAPANEVGAVIMTQPFESPEQVCAVLASRFGPISAQARRGICELWDDQTLAAKELEGATDAVLTLKTKGIRIGLLSDIWPPYYIGVKAAIPRVIRAADAIVLSFRTGHRKPETSNFLLILDQLGVQPEEAIMIGDTYEHDIRPAIDLGMRTIWVLARPDREADSIVGVLNGNLPAPTQTVRDIRELCHIAGLTNSHSLSLSTTTK